MNNESGLTKEMEEALANSVEALIKNRPIYTELTEQILIKLRTGIYCKQCLTTLYNQFYSNQADSPTNS